MLFLCGGGKISAGYRNHGKVRVKHMTQIDKKHSIQSEKNPQIQKYESGYAGGAYRCQQKHAGTDRERRIQSHGVHYREDRGGIEGTLEQLIYNRKEIMVVPSPEEAPVWKAKEGEYRIYVMLPYDAGRNFEIYQGELTRNARMESESHGEQTWEYLTVVSGEVELILEDSSFLVKTGGSLYFACDRKHVYHNVGETKAVLNMIITTQR